MGEHRRPGRNPRQGVTAKAFKPKPAGAGRPGGHAARREEGESKRAPGPARAKRRR